MTIAPLAWAQRNVLGRKPAAILLLVVVLLLIVLPLQLHHNVSAFLHDAAVELGHEMPWPQALPIRGSASPGAGAAFDALSLGKSGHTRPKPHADPARTTRCATAAPVLDAHGLQRPLVQYAMMMDAGSTGSRIHVYKFNYCSASPELESEYFGHVEPGLSSYGADASGAANSLRPLLDEAVRRIPAELRAAAPVSLKATAGLRLLGVGKSNAIIDAVRSLLQHEYPFPVADGVDTAGQRDTRGVETMDGRDEGVFAWITVNYLLNLIRESPGAKPARTAAVLDLGGGSTQIVFEPHMRPGTPGMRPGEHVYELRGVWWGGRALTPDFEKRSFVLYQNSYLGYGLKQARKSVNSLTAFQYLLAHPDAVHLEVAADTNARVVPWSALTPDNTQIPSPCYAYGTHKEAPVSHPGFADIAHVQFVGSAGGLRACERTVEMMMDKDACVRVCAYLTNSTCSRTPCSFAGVYQPSLEEAFKDAPIIALSYFFDRISPLGLGPTFTLRELRTVAERVCSPPSSWPQFRKPEFSAEALAALRERPDYCLDLTFMLTLFRLGYELGEDRRITLAKSINEFELGWALGAQLAVLQQGVYRK
ncbi:guanosine-diphosphatase [Malassezia sp. CBS 17886]|nr:guanosine-diphosphatase [Malassezia sp. CBS 17886]